MMFVMRGGFWRSCVRVGEWGLVVFCCFLLFFVVLSVRW